MCVFVWFEYCWKHQGLCKNSTLQYHFWNRISQSSSYQSFIMLELILGSRCYFKGTLTPCTFQCFHLLVPNLCRGLKPAGCLHSQSPEVQPARGEEAGQVRASLKFPLRKYFHPILELSFFISLEWKILVKSTDCEPLCKLGLEKFSINKK